ncbi:MAG: dihydropteroate synthase, partial [Phycisphaerae bacterium]|nr:dihydropteroate synthase [Phycisphaerae bacterium]
IDIGGESTRPGAFPVSADEQLRRILPVISAVRTRPISIDTTLSAVIWAIADSGAAPIINDVSAGTDDPAMLALAGRLACPIILMHRPGPSATMQDHPQYEDVVAEVCAFLEQRLQAAIQAGVNREMVLLDPGIGFGKTMEHDLALLRAIPKLKAIGQPIVIGVSRKKFIGRLTGQTEAAERVFGTAAAVAWSVANRADVVRVHDVAAMVQVVRVAAALKRQD